MTEKTGTGSEFSALHPQGAAVSTHELKAWFIREVLPLEASLTQFLRHNWPYREDVDDICHDVYVRVYESAQRQIPSPTKPLVFTIARNLLIDRFRRNRITPINGVPDLAALDVAADEPGPDRGTIARDELRLLRDAFNRLPPRAREVLVLKRIENLSRREIAVRLGIAENTVKQHLVDATRRLADILPESEGGNSFARVFNDKPYDQLHGYTNVNMSVTLSNQDGWQAMAYVKNIFDTTAITGAFLNTDDTALTTNVFTTDPRLFGIRVTKNW